MGEYGRRACVGTVKVDVDVDVDGDEDVAAGGRGDERMPARLSV